MIHDERIIRIIRQWGNRLIFIIIPLRDNENLIFYAISCRIFVHSLTIYINFTAINSVDIAVRHGYLENLRKPAV